MDGTIVQPWGMKQRSAGWDLARLRHRYLTPGWPLAALFVGYPLWWLLGISQVIFLVAAAVMALELAGRRQVLVPAAFGVWLLFLVWTLAGLLVAQVVAPGTAPDVQASRYFTWAYRMSFFVVGTVAVLYVTTLRLSAQRVARIFGVMFLVVVAGGWLGVVAPHLSFPSVSELILPHRLTAVPFIYDQVHPTPAELQDYVGRVNARPSAPFSYANAWGNNYATLLPFFVRAWLTEGSARRRAAGSAVLLLSVVPVIYSLDRGLWAVLGALVIFVSVRGLLAGRVRMLAGVLATGVVVTGLILATPLQAKIEARFTGHNSNEGRTNLSSMAVVDSATTSPVVGFGATRRVQGSFNSIAQGATPMCPRCTPPALGTQGALWTVTFAYGIGGALLFLGFFVYQFIRHLRLWRSTDGAMSLAVLLVSLLTMAIYDFSYPVVVAVMAAVALLNLHRDGYLPSTLAAYRSLVTGNWRGLLLLSVAGLGVGASVEQLGPPTYQATASVYLPLNRVSPGEVGRLSTLDEVAQVAEGTLVARSVGRSTGASEAHVARNLEVSAEPNTRILLLTYTSHSKSGARAGARSAVRALLHQQERQLAVQHQREVRSLRARSEQLAASLDEVSLLGRFTGRSGILDSTLVRALQVGSGYATLELVEAETAPTDPGWRIGPVAARRDVDGLMVGMASGAALGLTAGLARALWWVPRRRRLSTVVRRLEPEGIPLLATVDGPGSWPPGDAATWYGVERLVARQRPDACFALDGSPESRRLVELLNARTRHPQRAVGGRSSAGAVVVASTRTRVGRAAPSLRQLVAASVDVRGLVLVRPRARK